MTNFIVFAKSVNFPHQVVASDYVQALNIGDAIQGLRRKMLQDDPRWITTLEHCRFSVQVAVSR